MKISIIVPIYNVEIYLQKCIESLINQTYKNIEIILIDDGSPDNCGIICDEYAQTDTRIKVIHKKNGGLSNSRNAGVEIATGDYILFVDADDYIETTTCEELIQVIEKYKADLIHFNLNNIDIRTGKIINNEKFYNYGNTREIMYMTYQEAMLDNLFRKRIRYEPTIKITKSEIAKKIKFPEGMLAEDFAVFYQFLKEAKKIVYYDRCLYNYIHRDGSIMNEKSVKLYIDIYKTEKVVYQELEKICKKKEDWIERERRYFRSLSKTYAKIYKTDEIECNDIEKQVRNDLEKIDVKLLGNKEKLLFTIFKINKPLFVFGMRKIYKKL